VADTVAAPIEQQVNGVEGMLYLSSTSSGDGSYALTVTFEVGTDLDLAPGAGAEPRGDRRSRCCPRTCAARGCPTKKQSTNILLVVSLTSPDNSSTTCTSRTTPTLSMRDELGRVEGVGRT
jgi:HAE1 family hydrophobic/amphiphilic exporter-1